MLLRPHWSALLLFCACFCPHGFSAEDPQWTPITRHFPASDIGADGYLYGIEQTAPDTYYFGGRAVLELRRGKWTRFETSAKGDITAMLASGSRLWTVAGVGEIGWFDLKEGRIASPYRTDPELTKAAEGLGETWDMRRTPDGDIVFPGQEVLLVVKPDLTTRRWHLPSPRRLAAEAITDGILIAQFEERTWLYRNSTLEPISLGSLAGAEAMFEWLVEFGGSYIYQGGGGVQRIHRQTGRIEEINKQKFSREYISNAVLSNGTVYFVTIFGGLRSVACDTGKIIKFNNENLGIPGAGLSSIFKDHEGHLWVTSDSGVTRINDPSAASVLRLPRSTVIAGSVSPDGQLVFSAGAEVLTERGESFERMVRATTSIAHHRGKLLLGHAFQLAFGDIYIDASRNELVGLMIPSPSSNIVYAMHVGGVVRVDLSERKATNLFAGDVQVAAAVLDSASGHIIVATFDGQIRAIDPNGGTPPKILAEDRRVAGMAFDGPDLLLFPMEGGITTLDGKPVPGAESLQQPQYCKAAGRSWIASLAKGAVQIGELRQTAHGRIYVPMLTPHAEGISSVTSMWSDEHYLYVGGTGGLVRYAIEALRPRSIAPPAFDQIATLDSATGTTTTVAASQGITLPRAMSGITVQVSPEMPDGDMPPTLESRLLPIQEAWSAAQNPLRWDRLAPGSYELQVRRSGRAQVSEPTRLAITVPVPWYRSIAALGLYSALGLGGVVFAWRARTATIKRRAQELEAIVERRTEELRKANAAKSDFIASINHEIRNPLNGIVGFGSMLQEQVTGPRERMILGALDSCAQQLRATLDDVLDFAAVDAGQITLQEDEFDPATLVTDCCHSLDPSGNRVRMITSSTSGGHLFGDSGKLRLILSNYVSNALKYGMPAEADVSLSTDVADDQSAILTLSVRSKGPTLDPTELQSLFGLFVRGRRARETNARGTGLGLALCKRYADAMGGKVGATSSDGVTEFSFTARFKAVSPASNPSVALTGRVLAIEDETYNRLVLSHYLTRLGLEADWAETGAAAIALYRPDQHALIMTDWFLPDMSGGDVIRQLRQIPAASPPHFVVLSAYATTEKKQEALAAGATAFLSKPVDERKLSELLRSLNLHAKSAQQTPQALESSSGVNFAAILALPGSHARLPEFARDLETSWAAVRQAFPGNRTTARALAHRMRSQLALVRAEIALGQMQLLERALTEAWPDQDVGRLMAELEPSIVEIIVSAQAISAPPRERNHDGPHTPEVRSPNGVQGAP